MTALATTTSVGNSGNDKFVAGEGNDSYDGGAGFDTLDFSGASRGMRVDLNSHIATGMGSDTMKGVEAVVGSRFNDMLDWRQERQHIRRWRR